MKFLPSVLTFSTTEGEQRGFTLVELLVYLAIIGGVASAFVTFSLSVSSARNKTYVAQEVQANTRFALDVLSKRIREASGVNAGSSVFDNDPGVLVLSMDEGAKDPTIFDLDTDDGRLRITEGPASSFFLTSDEVRVSNLVFTRLTPVGGRENIRIQITVEYGQGLQDIEFRHTQSVQTTVNIRK